MMKKIMAFALAILSLAALAAGCAQRGGEGENDGNGGSSAAVYPGSLEELVAAVYAEAPMEIPLGETTAIDLADGDALKYYLGLSDPSGISEAVYSEALISAQAYSLCALRLEDGADAAAIAQNIFDNVDMNKWICVGADKLSVTAWGDVMLMVMVDSGLSADAAGDMSDAFLAACGADSAAVRLEK